MAPGGRGPITGPHQEVDPDRGWPLEEKHPVAQPSHREGRPSMGHEAPADRNPPGYKGGENVEVTTKPPAGGRHINTPANLDSMMNAF